MNNLIDGVISFLKILGINPDTDLKLHNRSKKNYLFRQKLK